MIYWILFYAIQAVLLFSGIRSSYVLMVALSILFSGLRFENGNDWFNYLDILQNIETYEGKIEWGLIYLGKILNLFSYSEHLLFFSFSFVTLALIGLSFNSIASHRLAFFLYLLTPGLFLNSFHVIRQMLAVSLFFYAVMEFGNNKSKLLFLFCGILGASFHYTAIIPFVFFVVIRWFPMKANLLPCVLAVALIYISFIVSFTELPHDILLKFSGSKFEIYSELGDIENRYKIIVISLIASLYLYVYYRSKLVKNEDYLKLFIFGVVLLNLFSNFSVVSRVSYYFIPFGLIIFCNFTDMMKAKKKFVVRFLYIALLSVSTFSAFSKLESLRCGGADYPSLLNYKSVFSK